MKENAKPISRGQWLLLYVAPPLIIVALAIAFFGLLNLLKPEIAKSEPQKILPKVEVVAAVARNITVEAESQGTVQPRTETTLLAEVSGRLEFISPSLLAGGFFKRGDVLARIDPLDYKASLANARRALADAKLAYEQEKAAAAQALEDWKDLGNGEANDLTLRKPQLQRARAAVEAAIATVAIAERDLSNTQVKAPYSGRVREKFVDVGQVVNARTSQLARIYSVDTAEIRLPLSLEETQLLELPESYLDANGAAEKIKVIIEVDFGQQTYTWEGIIDRTEGAIDPRTRLAYAVAQIDNPYGNSDQPPLKVGLFARARIQGKTLENSFALPRKALRPDDKVYVVDEFNRLRIKEVSVYMSNDQEVILSGGLNAGERICLTPLEYAIDGMEVAIEGETPSAIDEQAQLAAKETDTP